MVRIFEDARLLAAGVDWITATAKDVEPCERLLKLGREAQTLQEGYGYFGRRAGFQGYSGYGVEGCFVGTRGDGACLRASGSIAHRLAADIARIPVNITRLDLHITVQFDEDRKDYARAFMEAYRHESKRENGDTKRRTQLVDADCDGSTAAFGARSSAFYARLYDKGREDTRSYALGTWRIEGECKRSLGQAAFEALAEHSFSPEAVIAMMRNQFRARGVQIMVQSPLSLDALVIPRAVTDVERRLAWLERVARPVVRALHDAGHDAAATRALYGWMMPDATGSDEG
ncbi:MAG: replication initiation factor domain-containing protein [Chloroflexota bacterium]|nr:replication initiation factor domain-containing protein [Chloroflexota bacterium]